MASITDLLSWTLPGLGMWFCPPIAVPHSLQLSTYAGRPHYFNHKFTKSIKSKLTTIFNLCNRKARISLFYGGIFLPATYPF